MAKCDLTYTVRIDNACGPKPAHIKVTSDTGEVIADQDIPVVPSVKYPPVMVTKGHGSR